MAAGGLAEVAASALEMAMDMKVPRVHLLQLNTIFAGKFENNTTCRGVDIAKCLERLNGVIPAAAIEPYLKTSLSEKLGGFNFGRETFSTRFGRSPSTDSIAASNFNSDQGSVDSCNFCSNASDSNSGSSPCSPEEPDVCSRSGTPQPMPPIPAALQEDSSQNDEYYSKQLSTPDTKQCTFNVSRTGNSVCDREERVSFQEQSDSSKTNLRSRSDSHPQNNTHLFLQSGCSVPKFTSASPFQKSGTQNCVSAVSEDSTLLSENTSSCSANSYHSSSQLHASKQTIQLSSQSNNTDESTCSSNDIQQQCRWNQCSASMDGNAELVEHIRFHHVQVQKDKETFVCLWKGCKVYNRASCSLSWLERHILSHGGNRPFKCIVDNCNQRFPTQAALQRHVNSHFENHPQGAKANKCRDDIFPKSFRRRKHLKYKKRSSHGRAEDFFDANIMEQIRYKLVETHSCSNVLNSSRCITFQSRVKARRIEKSGKAKVLLEWIPQNLLPDCWVSEESIIKYKTVPISSLPPESLPSLGLHSSNPRDTICIKQRRK